MGNVILLGITSLLTDFSSEMVVPILPMFIASVGGSAVAIGLIFGTGDAVASLLQVVSGKLADRTRRYKLFTLIGYAASALAKFGYVGAVSWNRIAVVRPIERLGKGFRDAPRDAIVSESVGAWGRGRAFGIQRAMDSGGAILGSLAVVVFYVWGGFSFRTIFFVSALIGCAAVLPVLLVRVPPALGERARRMGSGKLPAKARAFIAIATLFALGNFSIAIFLLAAGGALAGEGTRTALTGTLAAYLIFKVVDTLASMPAGALSDRIGRRRVVLLGYGTFALVCTGFALFMRSGAASWRWAAALFAAYGLFTAFVDAAQRAMVSDLSPQEARGTALGLFQTLTGLAAIPAGFLAGSLYGLNPLAPFVYGAILAVAAAILLAHAIRTA